MDLDALAAQFGGSPIQSTSDTDALPAMATAPWAANLSRQDQAKIQKDMYEEGRKRLAALQSSIADGGDTMSDLEEFGRLNRENSTGSLWQQITPDKSVFRSGPSMEMAAIQARLAPAQRQSGSGASSDRDVALFLRGLPSLENEGNTNKAIREDFERKYKSAIEKANAMQRHLDQYGNLTDFDSLWAQRTRRSQGSALQESPKVKPEKTIVKTGMYQGRKVVQYSDGSTGYAD
jgi:hypothetical protein